MPRQPRFVELDSVPWIPMTDVWPDAPPGPELKVLSVDAESGAQTMLFRAPPGWCTPQPESHPMLQEDVLLEGEAIFGEQRFRAPAYFCFPEGYVHPAVRTETGFTMIVTFGGAFAVDYHDVGPAHPLPS